MVQVKLASCHQGQRSVEKLKKAEFHDLIDLRFQNTRAKACTVAVWLFDRKVYRRLHHTIIGAFLPLEEKGRENESFQQHVIYI